VSGGNGFEAEVGRLIIEWHVRAMRRLRRRAGGVDDGGAAMLLRWWLQEQMLDGGMRVDCVFMLLFC